MLGEFRRAKCFEESTEQPACKMYSRFFQNLQFFNLLNL